MTEQEELLKEYQKEVEKCWKLAQKLDALNPELAGDLLELQVRELNNNFMLLVY